MCLHLQQDPIPNTAISPCLGGQKQATVGVCAAFMGGQGPKARGIGYQDEVAPTLKSTLSGGNTVPDIVYALQANGVDRADTAGCNGCGWRENAMYTLNTVDKHCVALDCRNFCGNDELSATLQAKPNGGQSLNCINPIVTFDRAAYNQGENAQYAPSFDTDGVASTVIARGPSRAAYGIGNGQANGFARELAETSQTLNCMHDEQAVIIENDKPPRRYIVRRLTPTECARLQGFPDWWCADVPHSDSAEYKLWGNGIALPCALYVIRAIKEALVCNVT